MNVSSYKYKEHKDKLQPDRNPTKWVDESYLAKN